MNETNNLLIQILLEKIQFLIDENTALRNQSKITVTPYSSGTTMAITGLGEIDFGKSPKIK